MAYTNFTNCTKEQYESIIYSEEDTNRIRIWFNNVELIDADEYCESFSGTNRILPDDGNKIFTLDNFVAKNYTLILRDLPEGTIISDQVKVSIGTLVNENNNTYEDVPIGIFNIQDTPINDRGRVTIKLRDNRVKFDFNYNAQPLIESLGGTATKKQILEDICNQAGVTNNVSTFDGEDDEIGIYDNTITATTYVSYIFEQAGLMPFINREGQLDKINLNELKVWRIPLSIVEKYEKGTPFKIERVVYESGIIKYESSNDETLDTLYLNSANPYINNKQQIDNIYNLLVGFSVDSVKSGKILGNPAIDPFDIILIYDDEINDNPISTSSGTNFVLENTPNAPMKIDLLGNTTQDTTTGKNLISFENLSNTTNLGVQISYDKSEIKLNGTTNGNGYLIAYYSLGITIPAGTYTISYRFGSGTATRSSGQDIAFILRDTNDNNLANITLSQIITSGVKSATFTTSASTTLKYTAYCNNSGIVLNNLVMQVQLESGSTATSYEPYTYGASPNPNYPQPIETTTGRNTIEVCGKNLFTTGNGTSSRIGVNATYNGSEVVLNGTTTSAGNIFYDETISLNTGYRKSQKLPAGTYTLSTKTTGSATYPSGVGIAIYIRDESGTILKSFSSIANYQTTLTLNSETQIYSQMYINGSGGVYNNYSIHFQIEKGSTATTYEPYIGNSYEVNLGKNLYDINNTPYTQANSATITIANNECLVENASNQYGSARFYLKNMNIKPNTTYTISAKVKETNSSVGSKVYYSLNGSGLYGNSAFNNEISKITFTTQSTINNNDYVGLYPYEANKKATFIDIQLEENSTASSYSPYFTPIELCKIGTYQDRLFKASGKNLFDKDTQDYTQHKYFDSSGNLATSDNWGAYYIPIKPNTAYSISGCQVNGGVSFCWFDSSKTFISRIGEKRDRNNMVSPNNASYIGLSLVWNTSNSAYDNFVMLEESTTATSYEPYGNYWYKYNAIGKVVLDGSENWDEQAVLSGTNKVRMRYLNSISSVPITASTTPSILSNYYAPITPNSQWGGNQGISLATNGTGILVLDDNYSTSGSLSSFKTWLSTHNLIVYYPLATPTYTKIENDELINQLNRLKTIQTVEGTTNIQQDSSSSPFELNVEYFNESYILKTLANNTYKYTGINRNEFNTEISLEQRKENVSIKSEATYQKLAKTEIDASNASINMITEELGFVDGNSQVIESIKTTQTQNSLDIEAITSYQEIDGERVLTGVKTGKGFTFNNSGLIIQSTDNTYKAVHNEMGDYYYDGETPLGETTNEGSKFKNMDLYGEFRYGKDDIDDNALFVSMKFTDGSEECFGHFWNGD